MSRKMIDLLFELDENRNLLGYAVDTLTMVHDSVANGAAAEGCLDGALYVLWNEFHAIYARLSALVDELFEERQGTE